MTSYILESVDRLGKSTLSKAILQKFGYHIFIHHTKPVVTNFYSDILKAKYDSEIFNQIFTDKDIVKYNNELYNSQLYINGFELLEQDRFNFIFDRFHLSEAVYASRYRNYDGNYVFSMECDYKVHKWDHVKLILLTTSDWSFIDDDGDSHDYDKRFEEQEDFITAFNKSYFKNKILIDINNNGKRKTIEEILEEIR